MIEYKLWIIIEELSSETFKTATYLADRMEISEKTVRTRIKELNMLIKENGAEIVSKQRCGYKLKIHSPQKWLDFISQKDKIFDSTPINSKERIRYLLFTLLNRNDYIKLSDMSEFLYISQKTLSSELKKAEFILNQFNIKIERKPYYGIRIIGHEFDKRCCILVNFMLSQNKLPGMEERQENGTKEVAKVLLELGGKYNLKFTESAFQNLVVYIYLSVLRMKQGMYVEKIVEEENTLVDKKGMEVARELYEIILKDSDISVSDNEVYYTGIYIAGKRIIGSSFQEDLNFVISEDIDKLVLEMLNEIYQTYKIEFRNNLNLRMMLNQHLIPMEIRLRYGIPLANPILEEIKEKYFFAYTMAHQASIPLAKRYNKAISEDEIGYLALALALALEQQKAPIVKKNILLVCASGKASSQLLMYKFKQEFSDYINSLKGCNVYDLEQYDLSEIDYIFTTVPIFQKVDIPILEIHDFLERHEIMVVKDLLQIGNLQFLKEYYKESFFFKDINGNTKEEVIHNLCEKISNITNLPDGFYDSVLERESLGSTDYGNLVAIPHPIHMMTNETIIVVAILSKEIIWSTHPVRVVIMVSLSKKQTKNVQRFFEVTTKFISNKTAVMRLIKNSSFDTFILLLNELGN